ncbi:uncharacterized protein EI97DRAFT_218017 [Westerdykella ornata]|uniref:Uncharacterized protein n=1 Tax=Westerdykella ornata TaxID=318751 RepID=A0A6A6JSN2_WESOR|nr:uncharacterized protein EI97DRAFT_218017 [Westerdykella ornata]KAF2278746.1 hypothetical protein EI97DRAFT_218017 [Westerdykella ornata]
MATRESELFEDDLESISPRWEPVPQESEMQAEVLHVENVDGANDPSPQEPNHPTAHGASSSTEPSMSLPPIATSVTGYTKKILDSVFQSVERRMSPLDKSFIFDTHKLDQGVAGLSLLSHHMEETRIPRRGPLASHPIHPAARIIYEDYLLPRIHVYNNGKTYPIPRSRFQGMSYSDNPDVPAPNRPSSAIILDRPFDTPSGPAVPPSEALSNRPGTPHTSSSDTTVRAPSELPLDNGPATTRASRPVAPPVASNESPAPRAFQPIPSVAEYGLPSALSSGPPCVPVSGFTAWPTV